MPVKSAAAIGPRSLSKSTIDSVYNMWMLNIGANAGGIRYYVNRNDPQSAYQLAVTLKSQLQTVNVGSPVGPYRQMVSGLINQVDNLISRLANAPGGAQVGAGLKQDVNGFADEINSVIKALRSHQIVIGADPCSLCGSKDHVVSSCPERRVFVVRQPDADADDVMGAEGQDSVFTAKTLGVGLAGLAIGFLLGRRQ